jgi:hypothetical protein
MSYRGTCHIGITTDAGAIDDPERFVGCLAEGFDEVLAAAGAGPVSATASEDLTRRHAAAS